MASIPIFLFVLIVLVLAFGLFFGITVLHDYLIYRDLMRRLREEKERRAEK